MDDDHRLVCRATVRDLVDGHFSDFVTGHVYDKPWHDSMNCSSNLFAQDCVAP